MRILYFTHISDVKTSSTYAGGNWINALINCLSQSEKLQIGVVSISNNHTFNFKEKNISRYTINSKRSNWFRKFLYNITHSIYEAKNISEYNLIIKDFNPDLIHIFGTESEHAFHLRNINIPVVIHIQGIMYPCLKNWFVPGINNLDVLFTNKFIKTIRGSGLYHDYYRHKKQVARESIILKDSKFVTGRTCWDKMMMKQLAPNAKYYHCDEMIRSVFFEHNWNFFLNDKLILTTIINENLYKGLDLVLEAALILTNQKINFTWNIIGIDTKSQLIKLFERKNIMKFKNLNVIFLGSKTSIELAEMLLATNIYIHPSHIDNSPNSICEAMLLGVPIISSDVGGVSSLIKNNDDGILFCNGDAYSLINNIKLLMGNKQKQIELSNNSIIRARERHNPIKIANNIIGIYQSIIDNKC